MGKKKKSEQFEWGLIILNESSGGVAHVVLAHIEYLDWIRKPGKDKDSWREKIPGTDEKADITCGSYENDRALAVVSLEAKGVLHFASARQALAYHPVVDVYSGLVY